MQIQVNTDDSIEGREALTRRVEDELSNTLARFGDYITRVEVHLSDQNSQKSGTNDKRCLMEARLAGRQPIAVTNSARSVDEAFGGAAQKLQRSLESTLGRSKDNERRDSIRGQPSLGSAPPPEDSGRIPEADA